MSLVIEAAFPSPRSLKGPRASLLGAQEAREGRAFRSAHGSRSLPLIQHHAGLRFGCHYCYLRAQESLPGAGAQGRLCPVQPFPAAMPGRFSVPTALPEGSPGGPAPAEQAPSLPALLLFSFLPSVAAQETWHCLSNN